MDELLNKKFLQDLGIELSDEDFASLSEHYESTLQNRILDAIVEELEESQLREMQTLRSDGEKIQFWLVENVPQLNEIIEDEIAILLGELAEGSSRV